MSAIAAIVGATAGRRSSNRTGCIIFILLWVILAFACALFEHFTGVIL